MTTIDDTFKLFCVTNVNYISSMKGRKRNDYFYEQR